MSVRLFRARDPSSLPGTGHEQTEWMPLYRGQDHRPASNHGAVLRGGVTTFCRWRLCLGHAAGHDVGIRSD